MLLYLDIISDYVFGNSESDSDFSFWMFWIMKSGSDLQFGFVLMEFEESNFHRYDQKSSDELFFLPFAIHFFDYFFCFPFSFFLVYKRKGSI